MSDVKDITPDLDRLDGQLDDLEETLQPLLGNLEGMASQLPLLDKAKLFSLTAYAIESLLFCKALCMRLNYCLSILLTIFVIASLKLDGADAQNHAVFAELKRVQQYFSKIKAAETPAESRNMTVNQEAAARILKADLVSQRPPEHQYHDNSS